MAMIMMSSMIDDGDIADNAVDHPIMVGMKVLMVNTSSRWWIIVVDGG